MRLLASSGKLLHLTGDTTLGRSSAAGEVVTGSAISGVHAAIAYLREAWHVRDLASRNGSWLNAARLGGEWKRLREGDCLQLGSLANSFTVMDIAPPTMSATSQAGETRFGGQGVLAIPNDDEPQVLVFADGARFLADFGDVTKPIADGASVELPSGIWRVKLPQAERETETIRDALDLRRALLRVSFSLDREHVKLEFIGRAKSVLFEGRSFGISLAQLACRWHEDHTHQLPASERGWYYRDELTRDLGISSQQLNLDLFRAKKALRTRGALNVTGLVERRPDAGTLRIGIPRVEIAGDVGDGPQVGEATRRDA